MQRLFLWIGLVPALLVLVACAAAPMKAAAVDAGATYVVVRHAEKDSDDVRDPSLSDAGRARAQMLARHLAAADLVAVYATGFKRAQRTAAPSAQAHGLEVHTYDAAQPVADLVATLRREHTSGVILVVGHSNTVPAIASALCGCKVEAIDESDYGNLYEIRIDGDGASALSQRRY